MGLRPPIALPAGLPVRAACQSGPSAAAAADAKQLSDVVHAPNYASKGVYLDRAARVNELPFKDTLAPAHTKTAIRPRSRWRPSSC